MGKRNTKKTLNFIVILGVLSPIATTFVKEYTNKDKNVNESIIEKYNINNLIENQKHKEIPVLNYNKLQRNILSRYPKKISEPNDFEDELDKFKEISAGDRNFWFGQKNTNVVEIKIGELGYDSKEKFLLDYSAVEIGFHLGYNFTDNGNNAWIYDDRGVEMETPDSGVKTINLHSDKSEVVVVYDEFKHTPTSRHRVNMTLTGEWMGNYRYQVTFTSQASLDYNHKTKYVHAAYSAFKFMSAFLF